MDYTNLKAGDIYLYSGTLFTARDAAHLRFFECIKNNRPLPVDFKDGAIYYAGPSPARPGELIGSCGPTTSARMDDYTPALMDNGLKIMIGKGNRSEAVRQSIIKHKGIYFCAVGGAAALLKKYVTACKTVAYEDLGTEAVRLLEVKNLPVITAIDSKGNSIFD